MRKKAGIFIDGNNIYYTVFKKIGKNRELNYIPLKNPPEKVF